MKPQCWCGSPDSDGIHRQPPLNCSPPPDLPPDDLTGNERIDWWANHCHCSTPHPARSGCPHGEAIVEACPVCNGAAGAGVGVGLMTSKNGKVHVHQVTPRPHSTPNTTLCKSDADVIETWLGAPGQITCQICKRLHLQKAHGGQNVPCHAGEKRTRYT